MSETLEETLERVKRVREDVQAMLALFDEEEA